jgi:hypothetical protein
MPGWLQDKSLLFPTCPPLGFQIENDSPIFGMMEGGIALGRLVEMPNEVVR